MAIWTRWVSVCPDRIWLICFQDLSDAQVFMNDLLPSTKIAVVVSLLAFLSCVWPEDIPAITASTQAFAEAVPLNHTSLDNFPPLSLVFCGQTSPHKPRLVVS